MILLLFTIIYTAGFFIPENMPVLYGVSYEAIIILLCLSNFIKTPYENPKQKAGWCCMTMWTLANTIMFAWFGEFSIVNYPIMFVEAMIFVSMLFYSQFRSYNFRSDKYDPTKTYVVFKKPRTLFDFIHSCIFRPVSSVSIVSSGIWFGYTLGKTYHIEMYNETKNNWLMEIDTTHEFVADKLEPLIGSRWSPLNNCCHAVWRIFPFIKFKLTDSLPCHMIESIIKYEEENGK
jgi:hypothetical protein